MHPQAHQVFLSCGVVEVLASIGVVIWASINCSRVEERGATRDQSIGRCIIQMMTRTIYFIGRTMIVSFKLLVISGTSYSFIKMNQFWTVTC